MFYDFSLYDQVDDLSASHRIHACSSFGPDFANIPSSEVQLATADYSVDVDFEIGWWDEGFGLAASSIRSLIKQTRLYLANGHGVTDRPVIMFGQFNRAMIGLYIGKGLRNEAVSSVALKALEFNLSNLNVSSPSLAMQLCGTGYDSTHTFGMMMTSNATFSSIQDAIKTWSSAKCLSFSDSTNITGQAKFTTPLVNSGDSCAKLAERCGISGNSFDKYNSAKNFCATLIPKQHVCCSKGDLPDFKPKPSSGGSCFTYQVKTDDNCGAIAAANSLKVDDLDGFNKKTWGWNGCKRLLVDTIMCLSKGTPPFPAPMANALCGPQVPGTKKPKGDVDIAKLNPCPLNACCDVWGQCGITDEFCTDSGTGAPGTAKKGTNGCISNCGTDIVKGDGDGSLKIAYFEGYGLNRECLFQDASQIDHPEFTHLHFAFGTLTSDYKVKTGDALSSYEFGNFKLIKGPKKILSFGGWDFSTLPATYKIFREGVTSANRRKMASNIADFIRENDLDGVDIDWEYPGAPDIPGIPAASKDDGKNYLAFLTILKELLPGKSVSIAAPSSYWYLKQYPIKDIAKIVDYIVYMTYDLHGQWDTENANSQEGCENGNCLRSQVNLTETQTSLAMITKAGVPSGKVIVGVTSYGRSFNMAEAGCYGPDCLYTGSRSDSEAKKGPCTNTAGYISNAEISDILKDDNRVTKHFFDKASHSDILVYDNTQWVGYMSTSTKKSRQSTYAKWGLGGTTDWASDLATYNDVPAPSKDWSSFKLSIKTGNDPLSDDTRKGNWTEYDCTAEAVVHPWDHSASDRWDMLHAEEAWKDAIRIYKDTDNARGLSFVESIANTFKTGSLAACGEVLQTDNCNAAVDCEKGFDSSYSGPGAWLIWNSFILIHEMYMSYHTALFNAASSSIGLALDDFENKFAPVPAEPDNTWVLLLIDLITVGAATAAGPFFNTLLKKMPYFVDKQGSSLENMKDITMTLIGQSTTLAKDMMSTPKNQWTEGKQDEFSNYMGQTIGAWGNITSVALKKLFNGDDKSIEVLHDLISGGKLIEGKNDGGGSVSISPETPKPIGDAMEANIAKSFFGYSIPAIWAVSKTYGFIIDSGYSCSETNQLGDYLDEDTMKATGSCYDGKLYYLVEPKGDSSKCHCVYTGNHCDRTCVNSKFSAPPGLDSLDGTSFGGITTDDLIKGSVRTYIKNGKKNGGGFSDPTNGGTLKELANADVTTPGYMRIPVCSPERAYQSWDTAKAGSSANYPCDIPPGKDECGDSTFENESSDASPSVDDCKHIIQNIQGDGGTSWSIQVVGKHQRKIAHYGTCAFGVQATKVNGNVNFKIGGQDVIDIINNSIDQFGGSGVIGAKGDMKCNGNVKKQNAEWGIYHTPERFAGSPATPSTVIFATGGAWWGKDVFAQRIEQIRNEEARRACDNCKRRKVKCDSVDPCANCRISHLDCQYTECRSGNRGPLKIIQASDNATNLILGTAPSPESHGPQTHIPPEKGRPVLFRSDNETEQQVLSSPQLVQEFAPAALSIALGALRPTDSTASAQAIRDALLLSIKDALPSMAVMDIVNDCIDLFMQYMFPSTPIVHETTLRAEASIYFSEISSAVLFGGVDEHERVARIRPFAVVTALCAAVASVMPQSLFSHGHAVASLFFRASQQILRSYEEYDLEYPDSSSLMIRNLHCTASQHITGKSGVASHLLGQAMLIAQSLHLYTEQSIASHNAVEGQLLRLNFWHLYLSDKAGVCHGTRPCVLHESLFRRKFTLHHRGESFIPLLDAGNPVYANCFEERILVGFSLAVRLWSSVASLLLQMATYDTMVDDKEAVITRLSSTYLNFTSIMDDFPVWLQISNLMGSPEGRIMGVTDQPLSALMKKTELIQYFVQAMEDIPFVYHQVKGEPSVSLHLASRLRVANIIVALRIKPGQTGEKAGGGETRGGVPRRLAASAKGKAGAVLICNLLCIAAAADGYQINLNGRKMTMYALWVVLAASLILETISRDWRDWAGAKVLAGVGIGAIQATLPIYVTEWSPVNIRGAMIVAYGFWNVIGKFLANLVLMLVQETNPENYKVPILTQWGFLAIMLPIFLWLPETPAYYAERDMDEEGKKTLQRVNGGVEGYDIEIEYSIIKNTILEEKQLRRELGEDVSSFMAVMKSYNECFQRANLRRTIGAALPGCAQQLAGLSFLNTYASLFFKQSGFDNAFLITTVMCRFGLQRTGSGH
ncbi:hypothetical protein G7Z17_g1692 [Cylindrodendrum hubeiense]|uniref:chitinase n=1 Tax=Cylindrodendrum hubeiense TaxID=595255 RepID=A0A9P5HEA1_9HYPO|nr:hypothetical protein G7Z17_g1692 [Cylindrodendrum hubeiense]